MRHCQLRFAVFLTISSAVCAAPGGSRADLFSVTLSVQGDGTVTRSFTTARDVADVVEDDDLASVNPSYTDTSIAQGTIDFRGIDINMAFPTSGSEVVFSIPAVGFQQTFANGATREDNLNDFVDYLRQNQDSLLSQILNYLVSETATDPVAGNPASLMSTMAAADFGMGSAVGLGSQFTRSAGTGGEGDSGSVFGFAARFSNYTTGDTNIKVYSLPLTYAYVFQESGYSLLFDMPLTVVDMDGAQSYSGSLGLGLGIPLRENWVITPGLRVGGTGSVDAGAIGGIASGSVTSNFSWQTGAWQWDMGNYLGYMETMPIDAGDTTVAYNLNNTVFRNGLGLNRPLSREIMGNPTQIQFGVINTQYFGDALYVENATEISVSVGTIKQNKRVIFDQFQLGVSYTFTDSDYEGFSLNFGYRF